MKKTLVVLAVALLAVLAVWFATRTRAPESRVSEAREAGAAVLLAALTAPDEAVEEVAATELARSEREEASPVEARPVGVPAGEPAEDTSFESETAWLEFRVRDRQGHPIPEAKVRIDCYRTREDGGSSHSLSDMPVATTDAHGIARVEFPRRLHSWAGPERPEIGSVCYLIEHPDFVAARAWTFRIEESPSEIILQHGALLIVAGFFGARTELVTDVVAHLSDEVRAEPSDWIPVRDGRPSCNRLPAGRHALYLTHEGEGGTWSSAAVEFELAEEEVQELTLELHPPRTLSGVLDSIVPRPVQNGEVLLNLQLGKPGAQGPRGMRLFHAAVRPDGSFEIVGLAPGTGEMIGMCDGWVSKRFDTSDPSAEESGAPVSLQQVDPTAGTPFVLRMEPTARLELLVLGPDGEPVEDATIQLWPNVHWSTGYSQIFLDREWLARTDASGRAEIENLPGSEEESLGVLHESLCLPSRVTPWGAARRSADATLAPGETTVLELQLEACKEER